MHTCPVAQATVVYPCPSEVHTCWDEALGHTLPKLPGVHAQGVHMPPPMHDCMVAQAVAVYPSPSVLQTRRVLTSAQDTAPGVHTRVTQAPAAQVWPPAHAVVVYPSPSELHTRRASPTQSAVPGAHTQLPQTPDWGVQVVPLGQPWGVV